MANNGPYLFGCGAGHLPAKAQRIAAKFGADLVNYTEPRGRKRHWFAGPNRGQPFDQQLSRDVMAALEAAGIFREEE
jgi:hypothetical protein